MCAPIKLNFPFSKKFLYITRSHFLRGWFPAKSLVLHDRPVDGKVASLEIGLVHKSVAFEAVKVGSISERKMIKTYILNPSCEVTG